MYHTFAHAYAVPGSLSIFKYTSPCFPLLSPCVPLRFCYAEPFLPWVPGGFAVVLYVHLLWVNRAFGRPLYRAFLRIFYHALPYAFPLHSLCVPLHSPWVFLWVPRALRYTEPVRFTISSLWVPRDNSCAFAVFPCVSPCVSPLVPSGFPAIFPLHSPCVSFRFPWVPSRVPCASHYTESPRFTMFMFPVGSPLSFLYILPVFLFVFPLHLPCVSFRFPWVPPRVPRASHYETPRFTMCSPWVTRYLSCTFVVCSLAFPVSSDICFLYILLYITPEFRHEFPVVSPLSLFTFSMCSVSFAVYSVLCSRCVSLYGICAFHHIPTTFPINSPCVPLRFSCVTPSVPRLLF